MYPQIQMHKRFFFVFWIVMGTMLELYGSTVQLTGFLEDQQVSLAFRKGKYTYVSSFLRKNRAAYEEEREGPLQARAFLYLVGDNGPLFPEDVEKEKKLTQSFLEFLPYLEEKGLPIDLLRAFWHLKQPLGPMATGPVFPNDYDTFFSPGNNMSRDPEEGALILLKKAAKNDKHAQYWLGHWWLVNKRSLRRLVPRLTEGDFGVFDLISQWAGRGAVSGLALQKHRQATVEENTFHQKVSKENQSDWQEGCGGWGCCPGNRLCPAKSGDGCDLRRFDPRACCGIGGFRNNGECECNCCLCGFYTTWGSKEAWAHAKECGAKAVFLCRQGSQYGGTCLNAIGAATAVTGLSIPDPATVIAGVVITGIGTGCQILASALPDTENERRQEGRLQKLKGYVQEVRNEIIDHEPVSEFPTSAGSSAFPTAHPSQAQSIASGSPWPDPRERERHLSAPPRIEEAGLKNWVRRSIKGLREGLRDLTVVDPDPPSLISASEEAALARPSLSEGSTIIGQPVASNFLCFVQESELVDRDPSHPHPLSQRSIIDHPPFDEPDDNH